VDHADALVMRMRALFFMMSRDRIGGWTIAAGPVKRSIPHATFRDLSSTSLSPPSNREFVLVSTSIAVPVREGGMQMIRALIFAGATLFASSQAADAQTRYYARQIVGPKASADASPADQNGTWGTPGPWVDSTSSSCTSSRQAQTRTVSCIANGVTVSDSACSAAKPATTQTRACSTVCGTFVPGKWVIQHASTNSTQTNLGSYPTATLTESAIRTLCEGASASFCTSIGNTGTGKSSVYAYGSNHSFYDYAASGLTFITASCSK